MEVFVFGLFFLHVEARRLSVPLCCRVKYASENFTKKPEKKTHSRDV
jgi:hypothetical protein